MLRWLERRAPEGKGVVAQLPFCSRSICCKGWHATCLRIRGDSVQRKRAGSRKSAAQRRYHLGSVLSSLSWLGADIYNRSLRSRSILSECKQGPIEKRPADFVPQPPLLHSPNITPTGMFWARAW